MNWQSIYFSPRVWNIHKVRFRYAREFFYLLWIKLDDVFFNINWVIKYNLKMESIGK